MILDTEKKAIEFVRELGVLEFTFQTDGIVTFTTLIPIVSSNLIMYEITFFISEFSTFYRMESMDSFLNDLDIFEITETYLDSPERNIIYHRKFETKEILNGNKSILGDYQTKQIKDGNDLVNNIVRDLDTNIVMLKQTLDVLIKNEEFEKAIEIREKIKKIESNNIK